MHSHRLRSKLSPPPSIAATGYVRGTRDLNEERLSMECMRERLEEVIRGHLPVVVVYSCGVDCGAMEMECMREWLEEVIRAISIGGSP